MSRLTAAVCVALALPACGGGGNEVLPPPTSPVVLADEERTATGGGGPGHPSAHVVTITGPAFTTIKSGPVKTCLSGRWTQTLQRDAALELRLTMQMPVAGPPSTVHSGSGTPAVAAVVHFEQCYLGPMDAGETRRTQMRAALNTDCACSDALGAYSITYRWKVTAL